MIATNSKIELKELMDNRQNIYALLSRLFEKEIDENFYQALKSIKLPVDFESDTLEEYRNAFIRYNDYFTYDFGESIDELGVDYASTFLSAGKAQCECAFPYESVYTSAKKIMLQQAFCEVVSIYEQSGICKDNNITDLMEDHIAIELSFMAFLCEQTNNHTELLIGLEQQKEFLNCHLLNWVPSFCLDIKKYADTEFYRMIAKLTSSFLQLDAVMLDEMIISRKERTIDNESFGLCKDDMNNVIKELKKDYIVYAPAFIKDNTTLEEEKIVRYQEISNINDIVLDRQSNYSIKETVYPVLQTLFSFDENESTEKIEKDTRDIIVFARACDINGLRRLDNIFLANGNIVDTYYKRMRDRLKIFILECKESFENCFCVSMKSNKTEAYSVGCAISDKDVTIVVKDSEFLHYFSKHPSCNYNIKFVIKNSQTVELPKIDNIETVNEVHKFSMWDKMSEDCISCGGCNTVCPTCSCYDTVDSLNQENSCTGERCRVWSSCMLPDFSKTAGGHIARPNAPQMMRFKTLHKVYDYNKRFGAQEHMCVGCGRCVLNCPKDISFSKIVNCLTDSINTMRKTK